MARVSLYSVPGGDAVLIDRTKRELEHRGVEARVSVRLDEDFHGYDLVHLFNFGRIQETYYHARRASSAGLPVVLTPLFWNQRDFERRGHYGLRRLVSRFLSTDRIEYAKALWRFFVNRECNRATAALLAKGYGRAQRETLRTIRHLLPNSQTEVELFEALFGPLTFGCTVVPNGIDPEALSRVGDIKDEYEQFRDCVLCVARIDPHKNQVRLARALRGTGLKLVLVGAAPPNHRAYERRLRAQADGNLWLLPRVSGEDLAQLYLLAKVHVLPSWFDLPGLVSLEAAAAGCNVVVSSRGSTREYFGDYAYYCEPDSEASIRDAVLQAHADPVRPGLREHVLNHFTWAHAAERTLEAYQMVLASRRKG